ncbi:hypothetical protein EMCRGX_G019612 [Ephydatia muelleri]
MLDKKMRPISICRIFVCATIISRVACSSQTNIEPGRDQTVLVNGNNTFRFRCFGNGLYINWLVNGMSTNSDIIKQRGIEVHNDKQYDDMASANLTVPTIVENNNTIVNCVVINLESPLSLSKHVKLILIETGQTSSPSLTTSSTTSPEKIEMTSNPSIATSYTASSNIISLIGMI